MQSKEVLKQRFDGKIQAARMQTLTEAGIAKTNSSFQGFKMPVFRPLQLAAHLLAWIPLAILTYKLLTGMATINPIQYATQQLGDAAILMLMVSLAVTPMITLTGYRPLQRLARPFGLYAFFYAALHMLSYVGVDYQFAFDLLWSDVRAKLYIFFGLAAFLIVLVLAVTSFRWSMKWLGKSWKLVHRLVYAAGVLVVMHYGLAAKGDLFRLQGDIVRPALYALAVIFFLVLRIPRVRKVVAAFRQEISRS